MRGDLLRSYVLTYLQEEIRAEALVRNIGAFSRFLELAALESGTAPHLTNISQQSGVPVATVKSYFEILEDTLILFRLEPFMKPSRKKILTTPRYFFYDLGVRNAAAHLPLEPSILKLQAGTLFEQLIILEIIRRISYQSGTPWRCSFWRTVNGEEVDLIIETNDEIIPIEIKYTQKVNTGDAKHLRTFMQTFGCKRGYLVGRYPEPQKVEKGITAIPWNNL